MDHQRRRARLLLLLLSAAIASTRTLAQFDLEDSHTKASLRGIHSLGDGIAWASGTDGTVLHTKDGGYLWQGCAIPPGAEHLDFRGIQASDENTAVVMSSGKGDLSRLYKTTDGCRTWRLLFTNPDKEGFWDTLVLDPRRFTGPGGTRAFLLGDPVNNKFVLYSSMDTGETWRRWSDNIAERPARAAEGESLFAASNGVAVLTGGVESLVFVTGGSGGSHLFLLERHDILGRNRWISFTRSELPFPHGSSSGAFSIAARVVGYPERGLADFMVVGGDYAHPESPGVAAFLPTRKYCCAWLVPQVVRKAVIQPHGYRSSVAYEPKSKAWITVGPNGSDYSTDDGKNWTALKPGPGQPADTDKNWNALSLPFVVGPHGRIGKLRSDALAAGSKP